MFLSRWKDLVQPYSPTALSTDVIGPALADEQIIIASIGFNLGFLRLHHYLNLPSIDYS